MPPDLTTSESPIVDYHVRVAGFTIQPDGVRAALTLMRRKYPDGFTRTDMAKLLAKSGIPTTKKEGTYISPKDGKEYEYPDNPSKIIAGRILERMRSRGVLRFTNGRWYFEGSSNQEPPTKFVPKIVK